VPAAKGWRFTCLHYFFALRLWRLYGKKETNINEKMQVTCQPCPLPPAGQPNYFSGFRQKNKKNMGVKWFAGRK